MTEFDKVIIKAINQAQKICVTDLFDNTYYVKPLAVNSTYLRGRLIELNGNKCNIPIIIGNSNIKELELIFNGL